MTLDPITRDHVIAVLQSHEARPDSDLDIWVEIDPAAFKPYCRSSRRMPGPRS